MAFARLLTPVFLCSCILFMPGCSSEDGSDTNTVPTDAQILPVTIKDRVFNLELALDEATRIQGLSDRPEIAEDGGMLFVFPEARRRYFVMRRCLVPIDLAYLDAEGSVVWMHAMQVEPEPDAPDNRLKPYDSHYPALYVIELREGTIRELGLVQGDRIDLPHEALKAQLR